MALDTETADRSDPQPPSATLTKTDARQGQNVRGMITVLVVSTLLIAALYAVMLALTTQSQPKPVGDGPNERQIERPVNPGANP